MTPPPTTEPWFADVPVEYFVGWSRVGEEGSDHAQFRSWIVEVVGWFHGENEEHMIENLLLARQLINAVDGGR